MVFLPVSFVDWIGFLSEFERFFEFFCQEIWFSIIRYFTEATSVSQGLQLLHGVMTKAVPCVATTVAFKTVTVPEKGFWGWLGFTSKVSLLSAQPWIAPALIAGDVATVVFTLDTKKY